MSVAPHSERGLSGALFLVTLTTVMFQVLLTRLFSLTLWYHFAFMAISMAMFGMTVGALLVFLRPHAWAAGHRADGDGKVRPVFRGLDGGGGLPARLSVPAQSLRASHRVDVPVRGGAVHLQRHLRLPRPDALSVAHRPALRGGPGGRGRARAAAVAFTTAFLGTTLWAGVHLAVEDVSAFPIQHAKGIEEVVIAMSYGISVSFWTGVASYLAALGAFALAARARGAATA